MKRERKGINTRFHHDMKVLVKKVVMGSLCTGALQRGEYLKGYFYFWIKEKGLERGYGYKEGNPWRGV